MDCTTSYMDHIIKHVIKEGNTKKKKCASTEEKYEDIKEKSAYIDGKAASAKEELARIPLHVLETSCASIEF